MVIIEIKKGSTIEQALKQFKYKIFKTGLLDELKERKEYTKKSVKNRNKINKAKYIAKKQQELI